MVTTRVIAPGKSIGARWDGFMDGDERYRRPIARREKHPAISAGSQAGGAMARVVTPIECPDSLPFSPYKILVGPTVPTVIASPSALN